MKGPAMPDRKRSMYFEHASIMKRKLHKQKKTDSWHSCLDQSPQQTTIAHRQRARQQMKRIIETEATPHLHHNQKAISQ